MSAAYDRVLARLRWKVSAGERVRDDGARVVRTTKGWRAFDADGEAIRVDVKSDGTPYTPRPWHTGADKPIIRIFPSADFAMRVLDRMEAFARAGNP